MPRNLAVISHSVDLAGYSNYVAAKIVALLSSVDEDLFNEIARVLARLRPSEFRMSRLESLLSSARTLNARVYQRMNEELGLEMRALVANEVEFYSRLVGEIDVKPIQKDIAWSAATRRPIRGRLLRDYFKLMETSRAQRIQQSLAIGFTEGKTIEEMIRSLRGTRENKYRDGAIAIDRRSAESTVRTVTSHFAASARESVFEAHKDVIESITWASTLDTRTSDICQIRDGTEWTPAGKPIGHKLEWLGGPGRAHWNCRSTAIPNVKSEIDLAKGRQRASVDGPVSAKVTFRDWIARQSAARQDEVLGATRGLLLRKGEYKLPDFYDNRGRLLTISELRARDRLTFEELGL